MQIFKTLRYQQWALAWTILILIFCNTKMPINDAGMKFFFQGFDKLAHLGFFFVLTILLFYGKIRYQHNYSFRSLTILKIVLITGFLGGSIEILQWKVFTFRSAEWWDFFCDMIGVFMGVFSYILLHRSHYHEKTT